MKKILVIKLRHHGDVLLTTALYQALHRHFPDVVLDTLVYRETIPLLENNPHLNHIYTTDRTLKGWARFKADLALLHSIRSANYDAIIHLTDQWYGALVARASQAPLRVGMAFAKRQSAWWQSSFTHCLPLPPRGQAHAVELNLLCLRAFNLNPTAYKAELVLKPSEVRLKQAQALLQAEHIRQNAYVVIHPAARWPFKCWEDDRFAAVVSHILQQGLDVVLTCSPDPFEQQMTTHIEQLACTTLQAQQKAAPSTRIPGRLCNLGGKVNLPVLAALLSKCRFYVGVDSAPMHMAAALQVPQIALFGPSWLEEWRPWSDKAHVIYAGDYGPLPHPDSINTDNTTRLLSSIPLLEVLGAVERVL